MIISVHIPKTAGRSFRALLKEEYGHKMIDDYSDNPLNEGEANIRNQSQIFKLKYDYWKGWLKGTQCIHGHFAPHKYNYYLSKPNSHFVTWLRDPIDRLVSHYFYRKKIYQQTVGTAQQKIIYDFKTFESYCLDERSQNTYTKFLYKFPLEQFSFIGIVEHFNEDYKYFAKAYLNKDIQDIPRKNTNYKKGVLDCLEDTNFIDNIKRLNASDYEIYNKALELREERLKSYLS